MSRTARTIASQYRFLSSPIIISQLPCTRPRYLHLRHRVWRTPAKRAGTHPRQRSFSATTLIRKRVLPGIRMATIITAILLIWDWAELQWQETRNDARRADQLAYAGANQAKIEIINSERGTDRGAEQIPTGNSTVPFFPRKLWLPRTGAVDDGKSPALPAGTGVPDQDEEYQLLGVGIRTVTFLSIQVYVVGLYVAHSDLSKLQEKFVHAVAAPGASTLVQGEKTELQRLLLDEQGSEAIWSSVLKKETGLKSVLRIVPTRNTNFNHMRDGWVRMISARGKGPEYSDAEFEPTVKAFKTIFDRRTLGLGKAVLLRRGADGSLDVWVQEAGDDVVVDKEKVIDSNAAATPAKTEGKSKKTSSWMARIGGVSDERISRLVWMGYLAGNNVASSGARKSVVDGVMELVERPIGTVDTQVV